MVHDGFDHKYIVNHSRHAKQVIRAVRQMLVEPIMKTACFFERAAFDDFQNQCGFNIPFSHSQAGMFSQYHGQIEALAVHYFPQLSFNPTARLNTGLEPVT